MIRITQVKLPLDHTEADLKIRVAKLLRIPDERVKAVHIVKQSVDARRRGETAFSYVLDVETDREEQVVARSKNADASIYVEKPYHFQALLRWMFRGRALQRGALFCSPKEAVSSIRR